MANTITLSNLAPVLYEAKDIVARELTGAVNSVTVNSSEVDRCAFGDSVQSYITAQPTLNTSYTAAMSFPDGDDQTIASDTFALDKVANVRIPLKGEVLRKLDNSFGRDVVIRDMLAQAIRKVVNQIESDTCVALKNGSSRATGTSGTTPFASDFGAIADVRKILADNGCVLSDGNLSLVINTAAGTNLRKLSTLFKVNESGNDMLLRQGELLNLNGFSIKESAQIASHTKGTAASSTTSNAGHAAGATTINLAAAGTGTIVAGDVINIASENNGTAYVVKTGDADVSDGGTIVLNAPGLLAAIATSARAITVANSYTGNIALHKSAAELAMRAPDRGNDARIDEIVVADDRTGLVFSVAEYAGYGMSVLDFTVFYGVKVWKPNFVATLLG
jgi:hypothetical protein